MAARLRNVGFEVVEGSNLTRERAWSPAPSRLCTDTRYSTTPIDPGRSAQGLIAQVLFPGDSSDPPWVSADRYVTLICR
jgi:hypothetical protein